MCDTVGRRSAGIEDYAKFWKWFFHGVNGKPPGWQRLFNKPYYVRTSILIIFLSIICAWFTAKGFPDNLPGTVITALAAILISSACAWSGLAYGLVDSEEMIEFFQRIGRDPAEVLEVPLELLLVMGLGFTSILFWIIPAIVPSFFEWNGNGEISFVLNLFFQTLLYSSVALSTITAWGFLHRINILKVVTFRIVYQRKIARKE